MNAISLALKDAGVPLPSQSKRTWLWLKDHPNRTYKEVAVAIHLQPGNVSSLLGNMEKRGMVASVEDSYGRSRRYAVKGKEYELLPLPYIKPPVVAPQLQTAVVTTVHREAEPKPQTPSVHKIDIESMTVSEARKLWFELDNIFGGG